MSFSWTYLTRRFLFQNNRDFVAVTIVGTYAFGKVFGHISKTDDNNWTNQRVYTHDETDIRYREQNNRTDGAVKREHALKYAEKIKKMRAEQERVAALDAFNYLNNTALTLWFYFF